MKYENQRPDLKDQIKRLVQSANSVKTVPHGIKTVNPGEGLQLMSGDGQEIFWDWETAREYDDRISAGREALAAAELTLAQTQIDLDAAGARLDAGEVQLVQAVEAANTAQQLVTTTAGDLESLRTTVGGFSDTITASEHKAADALAKSVQALASADGKNRITRSTSPASGAGTAVGDTHFVMSSMGGGGRVVRQQRWDGSTWQDETVSHEVIASVDLGKATVGELDGGRIAVGSLYADRIVSGISQNMVPDPGFVNPQLNASRLRAANAYGDVWSFEDGQLYNRPTTGRTFTSNISMGATSDLYAWPAYPGMKLSVSCQARATGGAAGFRWNIRLKHRDGSTQYTTLNPSAYQPLVSAWQTFAFEYDMPETVIGYSVVFQISAIGSTATVAMKAPMAASKTGTVLIENGAVTAEKVEAQSVAGAVGRFLTVEAMTGVFTESLTAKDATLLGKTVAQALTVEKLTARNVIVPGTIDVAQLNVTNELSAAVVNTMTVTAKRAFFTEGLTAAEATLLGTTVAEQINADTIGSRLVRAGAIVAQDSTGSVQINPSGITVRDAAPGSTSYTRQVQVTPAGLTGGTRTTPTVNIDGQNNWMIGEFSTAPDKQRVRLRSTGTLAAADFFGSNNTTDHLGIWHQAEAGNNTVSKIISHSSLAQVKGNPGMLMYPSRGEFAFAGRWARDTDTIKLFFSQNTAGMPAGAWADFTYTYATPFTSTYSARFPFLSVETATGRECVAVVTSQTVDKIGIRVVNKSDGPSGEIIVRGVVFNANTTVYSEYW